MKWGNASRLALDKYRSDIWCKSFRRVIITSIDLIIVFSGAANRLVERGVNYLMFFVPIVDRSNYLQPPPEGKPPQQMAKQLNLI